MPITFAARSWRADQYRGANAQKRGGGSQPVPLEELEKAGEMPMAEEGSPEEAFDRNWARAVYANALEVATAPPKPESLSALFEAAG